METGEVMYENVYMSPRPPPKISLKHEWKRELGSEHAQRPEVGQLSRSFQSNQPIPNPSRDRTGQPVVRTDRTGQPVVGTNTRTVQDGRKTSRSKEIDVSSFHEEAVSSDRTGQPVVEINTENVPDGCETRSCHESGRFNVGDETLRERSGRPVVNHDDSSHEQTMLNEVNMDFRIPGLPHSFVKHAQSTSVRELIFQQDLRQSQAYNPFSSESKKMIQEVGNIELFELLETDPKTQCKAHRLLHTRASLERKKQRPIEVSLNIRWTFFHFQNTSSRREDLMATDMGKKPGDKEYYLADHLKKKCKKKKFQGIHDRFLLNHDARMIENNRDEEVCRRWDVLADEDHTYHLSEEEYFYYKNKWWLHLNKSGSDTLPLKKTF